MKKQIRQAWCLVISFVMIFSMMFTMMPLSYAADQSSPMEKILFAGKTIPVGKVQVWNDTQNLFVKYLVTQEGWKITETHLFVGADWNSIPKTSTQNPIPGQFTYSQIHDPAVTQYTYTIPKSDIQGVTDWSNIVIAAHAVVKHWSETQITPQVTWERSSEEQVQSTTGLGGAWNYEQAIELFQDVQMDATVWDTGVYQGTVRAPYPYASWLYAQTQPRGGSFNGTSDLRLFRASFNIPDGFDVISAKLGTPNNPDKIPINDNLYVYLNQDLLFWGGTRANNIVNHEGMAGIQAIGYGSGQLPETDGWYIPGTFPEITNLSTGSNQIEVFTEENQNWGGMGQLMLSLTGLAVDQSESAWAEGIKINTNPKGNWGTYFQYNCNWEGNWTLVDTVIVPSNGSSESSNIALQSGEQYRLEASGTYRFATWGSISNLDDYGWADAKYSRRIASQVPAGHSYNPSGDWVDGADLSSPWMNYLQIFMGGSPVGWIESYNSSHIYTQQIAGTGAQVSFNIPDNYYGDNSGSLTVKIFKQTF